MPENASKIFTCPGFEREAHDEFEGAFYADSSRGTGRSRLCKECHKKKGRAYFNGSYYPAHKEELISRVIERRKEHRKK